MEIKYLHEHKYDIRSFFYQLDEKKTENENKKKMKQISMKSFLLDCYQLFPALECFVKIIKSFAVCSLWIKLPYNTKFCKSH